MDVYGLKSLKGSDGEVEVLEDIPEVANNYKLGDDVQFTATFNAVFDAKYMQKDDAIDVEAEEQAATAE